MSHSITINEDLYNEIKEYCDLNGLKPSNLCNELLKKSLTELKYGDIPFGVIKSEHISEHKNEQINERINEKLPNENLVDISKIPPMPIAHEILPIEPMSGNVSEEKTQEEQKIKKPKKVRVLN
jgi:predicted CopG family antitoxin